jgi:alanine dehydrogenase
VPHTSTYALANVTLPYVLAVAEQGVVAATEADTALARGLNTAAGEVVNPTVARTLGDLNGASDGRNGAPVARSDHQNGP